MNEMIGRRPAKMLWHYLKPYRKRVYLLTLLIMMGIGLQLVSPQAIRFLLDTSQGGGELRLLIGAGVIYLIAVLFQKGLSLYANYLGEDLGWAATNQLRVDLTTHCMRLDMSFHKLRTPGELIERIDGDVSTLADFFSDFVVHLLGNSLLALGVVILLFQQGWQFGLIGLLYSITALFIVRLLQKPMMTVSKDIRQGYAEISGFLEERLGGLEDIRANGGEAHAMNRLYQIMAGINQKRLRQTLIGGVSFTNSYMLFVFAFVATLLFAGNAYQQGDDMTIGTVYLVLFYINLLESPLKRIRRRVQGVQRAFGSISRINELFNIQSKIQDDAKVTLPEVTLPLRFANVTFGYKDHPSEQSKPSQPLKPIDSAHSVEISQPQIVLKGISFTLGVNRILGILGRTGSGKTTLTRLLFRLYDVDTGVIELGGLNVRDVGLTNLRQHIGMVTQDVQLFAATIRDNLTLFRNYDATKEPIEDAKIIAAIKQLGLESWFNKLPNGLDTMLQSGGKGLSAGEAQLLAFTRVFLRNPRLIILDEASSRLDPATERLLEGAIDRLLHGRSAIIIAHRLNTVQRADDILILENGRSIEYGSREELANDSNSRFSRLLQSGMEAELV